MERQFTTNASGSRAQRPDSGRKDAQGEYSADNLFIADSQNGRIRCVDASTGMITTVAGNGGFTFSGDGGPATAASLNHPGGVAVDTNGNVFIADAYNCRVRRVAERAANPAERQV